MTTPPEYEEDSSRVDVTSISVPNAWLQGASRAAEILRAAGPPYDDADLDFDQMAREDVDMFRPFGKFVGLKGVDDGIPEDDEEEPDARPRQGVVRGAGLSADEPADEDDVRDVEASLEESCSIDRKQRTILDTNDQPTSLDAACRDVFPTKRKTTERTRRAAGVAKAPGRFESKQEEEESDDMIFAGVDPLLFFVGMRSGGVSVAVGIPESFSLHGIRSKAFQVELSALADPKSKVILNVMLMKSDPTSVDSLLFSPASSCGKIEVAGPLVRPLDPELIRNDVDKLCFKIEVRMMRGTVDLRWDSVSTSDRELIRVSHITGLPYLDPATAEPFFICSGTEGKQERRGDVGSSKSAKVKCDICARDFKVSDMRQHIGFHLIHEREKVPAIMPCGFCGGESAQYSTDLTQVSGCAVWLSKKQPKMMCLKVGGSVNYSIAAAAKVSDNAPCTTRPIQCPACPQGRGTTVVHWSMNMRRHYERTHPGTNLPPSLAAAVDVSDVEREKVKKFN